MFGLTAYSQSPYSTLGGDVLLGVGDITANANVSAIGYRIQYGSGDITTEATVTDNGYSLA